MVWPTRTRYASMLMAALLLLVLSLALGACSRYANSQAAPAGQTTQNSQGQQSVSQPTTVQQSAPSSTQSPVQSNSGGNTSQIQNTDQQIQKVLQSLDGAQNDVTTSSSVQENNPQP